jgi:EAL and modified HD-GYP domain-containing signal transduction protein
MTIFVARQAIFDRSDRLYGYELLYRGDEQATSAVGVDGATMSARVLSNAFIGIGIAELAQGAPAFVNFTRDQLVGGMYELLAPDDVVIELLEAVRCDDETLAACKAMVRAGYRFALDDFVYDPSYEPLIALASVVKVDVLNRAEDDLRAVVRQLAGFKGQLLAERVENADVRASCAAMGFHLFQGYFHARPETLQKEDLDVAQVTVLRLLTLLREGQQSSATIEEVLYGDPSLCFKVLRIVNAAAMGGRGVESIQHALRLIGSDALHRWLSVILVASFAAESGARGELAMSALLRGRFCELLTTCSRLKQPAAPLFMTGMMSRMDALMRVPMTRVLELVAVSPEVRDALLTRTGAHASTLLLVEAYEASDVDQVRLLAPAVGVQVSDVPHLYMQAVEWAGVQMSAVA